MFVPVLVMLALGLWGLDRGGMWRDEAVTFQVARRSVPQIWHLLHSVDAVHGLYYLLMHVILAVHPGEVLLRLPSVLGAAATAGFVAALGVRLGRPRIGLWAGLLYAVTPMAGHYAQEGRSYAIVAAGAAGATLLLVSAVRGGRWWPYAAVVAVTCLLHEFAVLVLLAHAGALALARMPGRVWREWVCAAGVAGVLLLPLVLVSRGQAGQVGWLAAPDGAAVEQLVGEFAGPVRGVLVPCLVLVALAVRPPLARKGELSLAAVALPLLVVPPGVLIAVSQVQPLYVDRYVLYALAGAPLLAAAGADRLLGVVGRLCLGGRRVPTGSAVPTACPHTERQPPGRRIPRLPFMALTGVLGVTLAFVTQLPLHEAERTPEHRPDDLAAVSTMVKRELRPGDPVLFLPSIVRRSAVAYPERYREARDVALSVPADVDGTLYGTEVGPEELRRRLDGLAYVWVVTEPFAQRAGWRPGSPTERLKLAVLDKEFVRREEVVRRGVTLRLYVRSAQPRPLAHWPTGGPA